MAEDKYLTVTDLNYYITQKFKNDPYLHKVFLQGELSNFRYRRHSHQYFSLKDDKSKINVVMFRSYFEHVKFKPEEGMKVYVVGYVSVYSPQGSYQFYAEKMEQAGLGALYEQLKQLEAKLQKEGLFDKAHKKQLPHFPDRIAVVTSASGAVIHDIMITANRRFPHTEVDLFPAQVQGQTAADSLVRAMKQIAAAGQRYDVMIIGRGGGSLEDLWPFNEEEVVRQVYKMKMPVISSVGHETDTTLCDLVADVRAATPTAAAEYATPNLTDELMNLQQLRTQLLTSMQELIKTDRQRLHQIQASVILREPTRLYDQQVQTVDLLKQRLRECIQHQVENKTQQLQLASQRLLGLNPQPKLTKLKQTNQLVFQRLKSTMQHLLTQDIHTYQVLVQQLNDYSPLKTLSRGFVYTTDRHGKTVVSVAQLHLEDKIRLHFKDGQAQAKVLKIRSQQDGKQEK